MNVNKCHVCGRSDVRLYRGYGSFLRDSDITCNDHIPKRLSARAERRSRARLGLVGRRGARRVPPQPTPMKRTAWIVPLIEAPDGSVWGYTSCPDVDIQRWGALPDASEYAPRWSLASGPGYGWGEKDGAL